MATLGPFNDTQRIHCLQLSTAADKVLQGDRTLNVTASLYGGPQPLLAITPDNMAITIIDTTREGGATPSHFVITLLPPHPHPLPHASYYTIVPLPPLSPLYLALVIGFDRTQYTVNVSESSVTLNVSILGNVRIQGTSVTVKFSTMNGTALG